MEVNRTYIRQLASQLINELYVMAKSDPRIMVTNWLAYAYRLIYQEASAILPYKIGELDDFLSGDNKAAISQIEKIIGPKLELQVLVAWHELHWLKSQLPEFESDYYKFSEIQELKLPNFILS